ncbi:Asp-tRNA(Asn)/Glu-tRNA(Gln) amidotransferase GatCAB subunit A, partial [Salmonella enterica subsp. enterica]
DAEVEAVVCAAAQVLRGLGATVVDVRVPDAMRAEGAGSGLTDDWAANCAVEAAVAHAASYPARRDEYGPVLASVIEAGRALSGIDYQQI